MKRRRGRPIGFKMSEESKEKTRQSKLGHKHKEETKQKISDGVKRFHETGAPIEVLLSADLDKCGKSKVPSGYIIIYIPNPIVGEPSYKQRYHVAIMEQFLERKLLPGEEIHHWGRKDDNRFELLRLCKDRVEHNECDRLKKMFMDGCDEEG